MDSITENRVFAHSRIFHKKLYLKPWGNTPARPTRTAKRYLTEILSDTIYEFDDIVQNVTFRVKETYEEVKQKIAEAVK